MQNGYVNLPNEVLILVRRNGSKFYLQIEIEDWH